MKDFAKSIRIGNATDKNGKELKVGDTVLVKTDDPSLNGGKIVRISGSQVSVDVTGDNDIWTTPGNLCTKIGNAKTGNSNKEEIIKKKKEQGATLKVDNGQKLEFSDGTTYVKTSFSDDYREAHNHVGNKAIVLKEAMYGLSCMPTRRNRKSSTQRPRPGSSQRALEIRMSGTHIVGNKCTDIKNFTIRQFRLEAIAKGSLKRARTDTSEQRPTGQSSFHKKNSQPKKKQKDTSKPATKRSGMLQVHIVSSKMKSDMR